MNSFEYPPPLFIFEMANNHMGDSSHGVRIVEALAAVAGDFRKIVDAIKSAGLLSCCTPFDEASVDVIEEHGFDHIKIASCPPSPEPRKTMRGS
jgi:N-acetylneuraminate synthase